MTTPTRVQIGPHAYAITLDDELAGDDFGRTDVKRLRIHVGTGQAPSQERDTVLHEVLHAALSTSGASNDLEYDDEERLVSTLTATLLGVLRINPGLVAYLTADG